MAANKARRTDKHIRHLPHIRTFLDNDDAGRKAVGELINAGFKVEDMSRYYKDFKDLNEFHVSRVREQKKFRAQEQIQVSTSEQYQDRKSKQVKHKMR